QGKACQALARAIRLPHPFDYAELDLAPYALLSPLAYLIEHTNPPWTAQLHSLGDPGAYLITLDGSLAGPGNPDAIVDEPGHPL
ncbi:YccS family putative transporter, partial [Pseudomonas aeruginosa]